MYKEVGFESALHLYIHRGKEPSAKMEDNVPMEVKERLYRLNNLVAEMSKKAMKKYEGQIVEVLVEGKQNNPDVLAVIQEETSLSTSQDLNKPSAKL